MSPRAVLQADCESESRAGNSESSDGRSERSTYVTCTGTTASPAGASPAGTAPASTVPDTGVAEGPATPGAAVFPAQAPIAVSPAIRTTRRKDRPRAELWE